MIGDRQSIFDGPKVIAEDRFPIVEYRKGIFRDGILIVKYRENFVLYVVPKLHERKFSI